LAQGCPIVSSDAGGSPEIAEHERSALVFPTGNVGALADAVGRLLDDPELAKRLGAQALIDYRAKFLPSDVARTTLDFYASVLDRAKKRN
jgi:glycosyltransferase involved in cell wall biosynthesis